MWHTQFWKEAAERAVKSAAQAMIGVWTLDGFNVLTADWKLMLGAALGGAGLSVLTSIVSLPFGEPEGASAVRVR